MNDRIKELLKESTYDVLGVKQVDQKKFAELIVRECASICINENVSNIDMELLRESGKFTVQDLATKSCGENLAKQIKKYFGVE